MKHTPGPWRLRAVPLPGLETPKPAGQVPIPGPAGAGKKRISHKERRLRIRYLAERAKRGKGDG